MIQRFTSVGFLGLLLALSLPSQAQSPVIFPQPTGYSTSSLYPQQPRGLATADLNRDGRADVAAANLVGNSVGVLLNGPTGRLGAVSNYDVGGSPNAIVAGSFNADAFPDLATSNYSGSVSVLINTRTGRFGTAQQYALPNTDAPIGLASGDLTGDGFTDLAVLTGTSLHVLPGQGTGSFGSFLPAVSLPQRAEHVVIADMNADGRLDVVVSNGSLTFEILRNTGAGILISAGRYPGAQRGIELVVGDFNTDGRPDVAQGDYASRAVSVALATATGFAVPVSYRAGLSPASITSGDVNADGLTDLAVANEASNDVTVLLGSGTGTFTDAGTFLTGVSPLDIALADLTGDGRPDLITANGVQSNTLALTVLPNAGASGFASALSSSIDVVGGPTRLAQGDLNGDGRLDVVTVNASPNAASSKVAVLLRQANGALGPEATYSVGTTPEALVLADVNGDGGLDVATANRGSGSVSVLLNVAGTGILAAGPNILLSGEANDIAAADFNGDSRMDLAVSGPAGNTVAVLLNTAGAGFAAPLYLPTGTTALRSIGLVATDVDGDNRPDLAVIHHLDNALVVLRNRGSGQFAAPVAFDTQRRLLRIFAADLTGDNRPELLLTGGNNVEITVLRNSSSGSFELVSQPQLLLGTDAAIGDLNGDNQPEVLLVSTSNSQSNTVQILSNSNGVLTSAATFLTARGPRAVAIGDVNADGRPDVSVAHSGARSVTTYLLGTTTVTGTQAARPAAARLQVYPNPAATSLHFQVSDPAFAATGQVQLRELTGRVVYSAPLTTGPGCGTKLPVTAIARGSYILVVTNGSGQQLSQQVVLQ